MGIMIESSVWEPKASLYIFIFLASFLSILLLPNFPKKTLTPFDHGTSPSFLRFQRHFLLIFSLASGMEGVSSVFGEYELAHYGLSREQMVVSLCVGYLVAFFFSAFLGVLCDLTGQKKACLFFCALHLLVGIWRRMSLQPNVWVASICLSLATSIFSFSFETWMVVEHDKIGYRHDILTDTFWLMTFFESASFIGSQMLANWLLGSNAEKRVALPSISSVILAMITIISITKCWAETPQITTFKDYKMSFYKCIFCDKRIWLLACAQASIHFSIAVFWILWAPTLVADGREVHLGLIFPCLLGARMLGSTALPWLTSEPSSLRTEDYLVYSFITMGLVLSVVAYDYQEIGFLVTVFCLFHACAGLILPSLARLRTMYIPNELRGGMISLSLAPANAAILVCLVQGGYYRNIGNATIFAIAALGLFIAAGCMHMLKRRAKQPYQNGHKL